MRFLTFLGRRWGRDPSFGAARTVRTGTASARRTSGRGSNVVSFALSAAPRRGSERRPGT
jgi:hypothetical protein